MCFMIRGWRRWTLVGGAGILAIGVGPMVTRRPEAGAQSPAPTPAGQEEHARTPYGQALESYLQATGQTEGEGLSVAGEPVPGDARFGMRRKASPLNVALAAIKDAKDETDKEKAREVLSKVLGEQYDRNLAAHEKALQQMEQRLAKLREQLSRRRSAKGRMVELRMQTLISEAEGLGWPSAAGASLPAGEWRSDPFASYGGLLPGVATTSPMTFQPLYPVPTPPIPPVAAAAPEEPSEPADPVDAAR